MGNPCISKTEISWPASLLEMDPATLYFESSFQTHPGKARFFGK